MIRKIDSKTTKQIVIDLGWHRILKKESAEQGRTIREIVEEILGDYLAGPEEPDYRGAKGNKKKI